MKLGRTLASALLALGGACAANPHAGLEATRSRGLFTVHARDAATAERVLGEFEALQPRLCAGPWCAAPEPVEIFCIPVEKRVGEGRNLTEGAGAALRLTCIEIDVGRELCMERFVIGHELAHRWLAPVWRPLPQFLEEGLADQAGVAADPEAGVFRRVLHGVRLLTWAGIGYPARVREGDRLVTRMIQFDRTIAGLPPLRELLALDAEDYHDVGGEANLNLAYAIGYVLVETIGHAKLRELCLRAEREGLRQIPPEWLLGAAALGDGEEREFGVRGMRLMGEAEQAELERSLRGEGPFRLGDG